MAFERYSLDEGAYKHRSQTGPCFVCQIVAGKASPPQHVVYEDEKAIAVLDLYPRLYGHTLVAPREHRIQVAGDFSEAEYLALQAVVFRVAEAVRAEVQPERLYVLSLGSHQGNAHVHWHIAPLPPGVPYDEQQVGIFRQGILRIPEAEQSALARRLRRRLGLEP